MLGLPTISIRRILLLTIGTLTLLITLLVAEKVLIQWQQLYRIEALKESTVVGDKLFDMSEKLSAERQVSYSILHAPDPAVIGDMLKTLAESRKEVDDSFRVMLPLLNDYSGSDVHTVTQNIQDKFKTFQKMRPEIDRVVVLPLKERNPRLAEDLFNQSVDIVSQVQLLWRYILKDYIDVDPVVNAQMRFKYFLWMATEYTSRERSIIGRLIVENAAATPQEQEMLLRWQGTVDWFWTSVGMVADQGRLGGVLSPYLKDAKSDYDNVYDMVQGTFLIPGEQHMKPYPINGELWLELSRQSNESLYALKDVALKQTHAYVGKIEMEAQRQIWIHATALALTLLLCAYSFRVVTARVLGPINTMVEALIATTQGRPVLPALLEVKQNDEIGKLAHVLSVFQKNMEEIKNSSVVLGRYIEELKRSNQELDDFAYIASHDLKEPLRGMITQTSFLLEDYQEKLDVEAIRRMRRLIFLSQRMDQLISDLLYFSRLGRTEMAVQETDLNVVISEVRQMMDTFLKERNATVVIPRAMPRVVCDKLRITEVFRNLITNAVKYNDKPERIVEVGYVEKIKAPDGMESGAFYVKDNGIGIEPEFHEAIFRIFKRLKSPTAKDDGGTGSGLTFVKKIIERHKGHIWLDSAPGRGSTFYFTLGKKT